MVNLWYAGKYSSAFLARSNYAKVSMHPTVNTVEDNIQIMADKWNRTVAIFRVANYQDCRPDSYTVTSLKD